MMRELFKVMGLLPDPNKQTKVEKVKEVKDQSQEIELEIITTQDTAGSWTTSVYRVPYVPGHHPRPLADHYSLTWLGDRLYGERKAIRDAKRELKRKDKDTKKTLKVKL